MSSIENIKKDQLLCVIENKHVNVYSEHVQNHSIFINKESTHHTATMPKIINIEHIHIETKTFHIVLIKAEKRKKKFGLKSLEEAHKAINATN